MLDSIAATNYPKLIVEYLIQLRRMGMDFDAAWSWALVEYPPIAYGFGTGRSSTAGVETPIDFLRRHAEAAYNGETAAPYCSHVDCTRIAIDGTYCASHAIDELVTPETRERIEDALERAILYGDAA